MKYVFEHDFTEQMKNIKDLYQKLANKFIKIAKPVYVDPVKQYHVYAKIKGKNYSPDIFPDNKDIHLQLGKYTGYIHKTTYPYYGALNCQNKHDLEKALLRVIEIITRNYWNGNDAVKGYYNAVSKLKISAAHYALIMPDISANQFIYSDNMDKIEGLIDLDAYIIGPKELELAVLELCIPNQGCANYFKSGYEQYNTLPLLENDRPVYRYLFYLCDPNNPEGIESFLNRNIYYP
jgi:hypothetical protein